MKCRKIFVLLLTALLLALGVFAASAAEVADSGQCGDDLTWTLTADGTLTITGSGAMWDYDLGGNTPWEERKGEITFIVFSGEITHIGDWAFRRCANVTAVYIPQSITSIGSGAFYDCTALAEVTGGVGVTQLVDGNAFSNAPCVRTDEQGLQTVLTWVTDCAVDVQEIIIPEGTTIIAGAAFYGCTELISVEIPDSVVFLGDHAFQACHSLESIVIPDKVISIGTMAFHNCKSLTEVTVGASVEQIDLDAFCYCTSLRAVHVAKGNTTFCSVDGALYSADMTWLYFCPPRKPELVIPDSVTSIHEFAFTINTSLGAADYKYGLRELTIGDGITALSSDMFQDLTNLTHLTIGNSVTEIEDRTFAGMESLTTVHLGDGVTHIGLGAFHQCTALTDITLGGSLVSIGDSALRACTSLTTVTIPASVESIGWAAFANDASLTTVIFEGDAPQFSDDVFYNDTVTCCYPVEADGWTGEVMQDYGGSVTWYAMEKDEPVPDFSPILASGQCGDAVTWTLTESGTLTVSGTGPMWDFPVDYPEYSVYADQITTVVIEKGVTTVGSYAFYGCNAITSLSLPEGLTELHEGAFYGCLGISRVTIPTSVTKIAGYTFKSCKALDEIEFLGGAPTIGTEAFGSISAVCFYPAAELSWTAEVRQNYGGTITWTPYGEGHVHSYTAEIVPPTCTEKGHTTYTCACGDRHVGDYVDATGHSWDGGVVTTQPTESREGVRTYTCKTCGETKTEVIEKLVHTHDYSKQVTAPTCIEKGYTTYTCACGHSYRDAFVAATGHSYGEWYVTVEVSCMNDGEERHDCKNCGHSETRTVKSTGCPSAKFSDVPADVWYHSYVDFVVERGLMNGTGGDQFAPTAVVTRATVAQLLYNMEGKPSTSGMSNPFEDVKESDWYYAAVVWAANAGVVSGNGKGGFDPNSNVTREQLAIMLYNYVKYKGYDLEATKDVDLNSFVDGSKTSIWAASQLKWACDLGLIGGKSVGGVTYLAPQDTATRAEIATIFMRFYQMVEAGGQE